ncbi:hypothetical protein [Niveibacterium sp. SC-1]|uniref:hypothetical protein n=1 Tax=Niveibacterium sp. SC-1 TaxID=3135646 RepID=UPI00311F7CEB
MTQKEVEDKYDKFDGTTFDDLRDLIDAAERETVEAWQRESQATLAVPQQADDAGVKAWLNGWWVDPAEATDGLLNGCRIMTRAGRTNVVVAFDPKTRRVRTRSGTVYVLGMPETNFAASNRALMRRLGM